MRALWLRISSKRAEKAGEEKILLAIGKIVEVIFSTLLRLQEKSVSINEFNLSVWWEKKNILFFRSALQIISSRPRFALLAAAVRATRGRSSRYFRPRAALLAAASRWVVMFLAEIVIWMWEMDSSLSWHSTKATLYKIDRLEKDDNIVIKILFANGKIAEVNFSTLHK